MNNVKVNGVLIECGKQLVFVPWAQVKRGKYLFPRGEMDVVFVKCSGCGEVHQVNELLWDERVLPVWVNGEVKAITDGKKVDVEGD